MPTDHVVEQGDHISKLAEKYGFLDHRNIWDDPANASLKSLRDNPWVLFPGDLIRIPDKLLRTESVPTTKVHTFRVKLERLKLKLQIKDHEDNPIANTPVSLNVEGSVKSLTTDGEGKTEREILKTAVNGMLTVTDLEVPLKIGHLDPVDKISGQKARLNNLGYNAGAPDGPEGPDNIQFRSAVEEFQCDQKMKVDGVCSPETQAKLKEVHGS